VKETRLNIGRNTIQVFAGSIVFLEENHQQGACQPPEYQSDFPADGKRTLLASGFGNSAFAGYGRAFAWCQGFSSGFASSLVSEFTQSYSIGITVSTLFTMIGHVSPFDLV